MNPNLNAHVDGITGEILGPLAPLRQPPPPTVVTTLRLPDGTRVECLRPAQDVIPQLDTPPSPGDLRESRPVATPPGPQAAGSGQECPEGSLPGLPRPAVASPFQPVRPLLDFNSKDHGLSGRRQELWGPPSPEADVPHRYAHAATAEMLNHGMRARLNVWHPKVPNDYDMTLAQTWITAYRADNGRVQTVESGWQVWHGWGTDRAVPFIYFTADGYRGPPDVGGCYNWNATSCNQFQLVHRKPFLGVALDVHSEAGGSQGTLDIVWVQKPNGNWWLQMNGIWLGYYPASTFAGGPLGSVAQGIDVGGEATGTRPMAEMGSGRYAGEGFGTAAFASNLGYYDQQGGFVELSRTNNPLEASMSDSGCYTIDFNAVPPVDGDSGLFFFFGGPGTNHFGTDPRLPTPVGGLEKCHRPGG